MLGGGLGGLDPLASKMPPPNPKLIGGDPPEAKPAFPILEIQYLTGCFIVWRVG